jgi:hypothetical protein
MLVPPVLTAGRNGWQLQEAMSSSLSDSNKAKEELAAARQEFGEQEARFAAEKAAVEGRLVRQQQDFEAQLAERTESAAKVEEMQAALAAQAA